MFQYLPPQERHALLASTCEKLANDYIDRKDHALIQTILLSLHSEEDKKLFWGELIAYCFNVPVPYYVRSETGFLYYYQNQKNIKTFLEKQTLDEQLHVIHEFTQDPNLFFIAISCSLSLIEFYQAAGHLICIQTYEHILDKVAVNERGLYATQIYSHALLLQKTFKSSKRIFKELGWLDNFYNTYGSVKHFVHIVYQNLKPYLCKKSRKMAESFSEI